MLRSGRRIDAIDRCHCAPRVDGVKGGAAAERSEGTLDARWQVGERIWLVTMHYDLG